tara:strand:- start:208511 stop:208654 length:144 start_codon:yes stop_codon:yes gene_type:complete
VEISSGKIEEFNYEIPACAGTITEKLPLGFSLVNHNNTTTLRPTTGR